MNLKEPPPGGAESNPLELVRATASLGTGTLLEAFNLGASRERLVDLAATLPDLFGTLEPSCLESLAARFGLEETAGAFSEILFLSDRSLHVIQPIADRPGVALLAVCPTPSSIGLVLSTLRSWAHPTGGSGG